MQTAVVRAVAMKHKAEQHLQHAISEQKFAHSVASTHLKGSTASNVVTAADAAVKQAKQAFDAAAATLAKASAQKKLVDSKLNNGQTSAKQAALLAAKTASDASKLQEKAIAA